jgi:hypothetical protein
MTVRPSRRLHSSGTCPHCMPCTQTCRLRRTILLHTIQHQQHVSNVYPRRPTLGTVDTWLNGTHILIQTCTYIPTHILHVFLHLCTRPHQSLQPRSSGTCPLCMQCKQLPLVQRTTHWRTAHIQWSQYHLNPWQFLRNWMQS